MNAENYWKIFLETGSPEMYVLYSHTKRMEEHHVFDGQGSHFEGHKLQ